jgi:hypothetical protein
MSSPLSTAVLAWLVPGAGHFLAGQTRKAAIFFVVLTAMFVLGPAVQRPIVRVRHVGIRSCFLAALAQWALGGPRLLAALAGGGRGDVVAVTYEYGNTFFIVAGLLNSLIVLDAMDVVRGVKGK